MSPIQPHSGGFALDRTQGKIFGVCGGIANYLGVNPLVVRLAFVLGAFFSVGTVALVYLAIALLAK